jgi:hypothetical protein
MRTLAVILISVAVLAPAAAQAADPGPAESTVPVTGAVATLCVGGSVTGGDTAFNLGVLIDTTTGFMLSNLSAPPKTVIGSFCNTRSTIEVSATPMMAQSFTGAPPAGFTNALDYTATASGWTPTAASYVTDAPSNPAATQSRGSAYSGPITVAVSNFAPVGGAALRLVADAAYQGTVTVTLSVAS